VGEERATRTTAAVGIRFSSSSKKRLDVPRIDDHGGAGDAPRSLGESTRIPRRPASTPLWESGTGAWPAVQDNCKVGVHPSDRKPLWDRGTGGRA
jgi:hypothetical protein